MKTIDDLTQELTAAAQKRLAAQIETARHDYQEGMNDCKNGIYDKWFRYNHSDSGRAYDLGWMKQNETTQNETVSFIGDPSKL